MKFEYIDEQFPDAKPSDSGWLNATCPACQSPGKFGYKDNGNGHASVKCFKECSKDAIMAALGERVVAAFEYEDANGQVIAHRVRIEYANNIDPSKNKPRKEFRPYLFSDGVRAEKSGLGGIRLSWYHRSEVRAAAMQGGTIWIVEGEAKCDRLRIELRDLGIEHAVTSPPGNDVTDAMARELAGASRVIVLGDNDDPGLKKATIAGNRARGVVDDVRVIEKLPNVGVGGDVADWLADGGTVEELLRLVGSTSPSTAQLTPRAEIATASSGLRVVMELRNDLGNADWFLQLNADRVRYNRDREKWMFWDGKRWHIDRGNEAQELAKNAIRALQHRAVDSQNPDFVKYALACGRLKAIEHMLAVAKSDPRVDRGQADFDQNGFLLNVENGTIDLRTGELRAHDPGDHITALIPIAYDPTVRSILWEKTLDTIFEGRRETVDYFQRATGYSLTGSTREECFFLLYGEGRNGKGVVVETLQELLREYRKTTQFETFLAKRFSGGINAELADLAGARIVVASEADAGRAFSTGMLKNLTGGDEVTTRFLYQNPFTYKPFYKIWLVTNAKPSVAASDTGFWERCKVIPFRKTFVGNERDDTLKARLKAAIELQGVLTWAVEGAVAWVRLGLGTCPDVVQSTEEYREENDHITQWIAASCVVGEGKSAEIKALLNSYRRWVLANGVKEHVSDAALGKRLERDFPRNSSGKRRSGIGLLEEVLEGAY